MAKPLQFCAINLLKYTENIVDKQPSQTEIQEIVTLYQESVHPTHIAISVPLDSNEELLKHNIIPNPLVVDQFTKIWADTIHQAGSNVYFRGTFSGIKNLYNFGFDKYTPLGSLERASADGTTTWLGRYYQWLITQVAHMQPGDIIGIIPEATSQVFTSNFFIQPTGDLTKNSQAEFLQFYTDIKKLTDTVTKDISPIYSGYSAHLYRDIINGWIPTFIFDLTGVLSVDYSEEHHTPQELEKALNDLYLSFRYPIFLSKWQMPTASLLSPTIDNNPQEFFAVFTRLRDKGILVGLNYFDGLNFTEGIFTDDNLNDTGHLLGAFFVQGRKAKSTSFVEKATSLEKPTPNTTQPHQTLAEDTSASKGEDTKAKDLPQVPQKRQRKKKDISLPVIASIGEEINTKKYPLQHRDLPFLVTLGFYLVLGAILTELTNLLTRNAFGNLTAYSMIGYTLLVAVGHAILDDK